MISSQNILRHELIGLDVLVVGARNPHQRGISGRIVDETKNLLAIETAGGIKWIPKLYSTFRLCLPGNERVEIDGSEIVLAPEKRISLHKKKRIT